jgi:hypothetical protein
MEEYKNNLIRSLDSSVGIALGYGLDGRGSILVTEKTASRPTPGLTQPPV